MQEPGGIRMMMVIQTACRLPYRQKTVESRCQPGPEHNRTYGQQGDLYQGLHPSVVRQYVMLLKKRRCVWKWVQPAASVNIAQGMEDGATRFLVVSRRPATVPNQLFAIGLPNVDRSIEISSSLV